MSNKPGTRRVLVHASGFRQSPYADIKPPGDDAATAARKAAPRAETAPQAVAHQSRQSRVSTDASDEPGDECAGVTACP